MNPISNASSTRVAESLAYIGGTSDAIALQEATQYYMADKIRESLKKTLVNAGSLLQNLLQFNNLKARASEYSSSANVSITAQSLISALDNSEILKNLFLNDGPKLGSNLDESQDLLDELLALGITLNAPLAVPVLITTMDKDKKILSNTFLNMSKADRDALNSFKKIDDESASSDVREHVVPAATETDSEITVRYEIFDNFSNLRPQKNDIEFAKLLLATKASALNIQFSNQLTTVIKTGEKLDSLIESHIKNAKEQSIRVSESQVILQQVVIELLQKLRIFKLDDLIRAPKDNEILAKLSGANASDNEILAIFKNMSDRVESVSSLQNNAIKSAEVDISSSHLLSLSDEFISNNLMTSSLNEDDNIVPSQIIPMSLNINSSELVPKFVSGSKNELTETKPIKENN